jgi:biopolymer transport protein ExbD
MPLKTHQDDQPKLDLTPMIDVVFLLVIFFMAATKFTEREQDIDLNLPEVAAAAAASSAPKQRVVTVHDTGQLTLDGNDVSLVQLTERLTAARSEYPNTSVVIRGDAACAFQHIAAALAACKDAKVSDLGITVRIAESAPAKRR